SQLESGTFGLGTRLARGVLSTSRALVLQARLALYITRTLSQRRSALTGRTILGFATRCAALASLTGRLATRCCTLVVTGGSRSTSRPLSLSLAARRSALIVARRTRATGGTLAGAQRPGRSLLLTLELFARLAFHFRHGDRLQAHLIAEDIHLRLGQFTPATHGDIGIEEHRPETHALQAADHQALGFPQSAHFTVAAFHHHHVVPMVEAFAAGRFLDVSELGRTVFQHDAIFQVFDDFFGDFTAHAHRVLAVHLVRRVHQTVGQFAIGGEHQQACGVDVQTADIDPAATLQTRQTIEHG